MINNSGLLRNFSLLVLFCSSINLSLNGQAITDYLPLIPRPLEITKTPGYFALTANTPLIVNSDESRSDAMVFNEYLLARYGFSLKISTGTSQKKGALNIFESGNDQPTGIPSDGYHLQIDSGNIFIQSNKDAGAFYALQTLIQLLPPGNVKVLNIPCVSISDHPLFSYRGMHLDVCRHFFPVSFIKKYIDELAMYKMNYFHWHLTDDQGWRIEIKKYPRLQEISSFRSGTLLNHFGSVPELYDTMRYGGYYTQDEIREIVAYAGKRHITIIPEIEMPGHALAALAAYPELACTPGPFEVGKTWGVSYDVFCPKPETFTFLKNVLTEVCDLFPGPYIHIGGDECPKDRWKNSEVCQALIKSEGLKDEDELQSYFTRQMNEFILGKGKRMIGWDEILEGGLVPDAVVMSWRGNAGGIEAAKKNHDVIMTPGDYCYFDHYQSKNPDEPLAIGGYLPLDKVYSFNPVPDTLSATEATHILGAQGNVWTEYIASGSQVEYMIFPRMAALAEALWLPAKDRDFEHFSIRLASHFKLLDFLKINYSKSLYDVTVSTSPVQNYKGVQITLSTNFKNGSIYYSLGGEDPSLSQEHYTAPFTVDQAVYLRAQVFDREMPKGKVLDKVIRFSRSTGHEIKLTAEPAERHNQGGAFSLVDGLTSVVTWNRSEFLGFNGQNMDASIDLGAMISFSKVVLSSLDDNANQIYFPASIEIFTSEDGKKFTSVKKIMRAEYEINERLITIRTGMTSARWVRVVAENPGLIPVGKPEAGEKAWMFVDEIEVE